MSLRACPRCHEQCLHSDGYCSYCGWDEANNEWIDDGDDLVDKYDALFFTFAIAVALILVFGL